MRRALVTWLVVLAACAGTATDPTNESVPDRTPQSRADTAATPTTTQPEGGFPATPLQPSHGSDGNMVAAVRGPFPTTPSSLVALEERVVRVDLPADDTVAVAYEGGELRLMNAAQQTMRVRRYNGATGLVYTEGPNGIDLLSPLPEQAPHGRPAVLSTGQVVYATSAGELVVWDGSEVLRAAVDALPDGDVLVDESDRVLVLTAPTDRYGHGILGDMVEPSGFVILSPPDLARVGGGSVAEPSVIEGRRALWADIDGDGRREVQVTVSNSDVGARLVVMEEDGAVVAEGAPIGLGNRWRHQIAFGAFSSIPLGVEVVTPHIGGIVTFNEYEGEVSGLAATREYTSHAIGSRELDMAVAVDVDGDGLLELLLPTQDRRTLVGIGIVDGEALVEWASELPSPISSNIAVGQRHGAPTIAVGTVDGSVFFWEAA